MQKFDDEITELNDLELLISVLREEAISNENKHKEMSKKYSTASSKNYPFSDEEDYSRKMILENSSHFSNYSHMMKNNTVLNSTNINHNHQSAHYIKKNLPSVTIDLISNKSTFSSQSLPLKKRSDSNKSETKQKK